MGQPGFSAGDTAAMAECCGRRPAFWLGSPNTMPPRATGT
jgi:hypothetical protein